MKPCIYSCSRGGKQGKIEDVISCVEISDTCFLFILVDGMGGLSRGEQAAQAIVSELVSYIIGNVVSEDVEGLLRHAMERANTRVEEQSREYQCKMGGTVSILLCKEKIASVAWLGDVRVYYMHDNILCKMTDEHVLDSEPDIVTRCLNGKPFDREIPVVHLPIYEKDRFVLCSDGFYNSFGENDILEYDMEILLSRILEPDDDYSVINVQF